MPNYVFMPDNLENGQKNYQILGTGQKMAQFRKLVKVFFLWQNSLKNGQNVQILP